MYLYFAHFILVGYCTREVLRQNVFKFNAFEKRLIGQMLVVYVLGLKNEIFHFFALTIFVVVSEKHKALQLSAYPQLCLVKNGSRKIIYKQILKSVSTYTGLLYVYKNHFIRNFALYRPNAACHPVILEQGSYQ